MFSSLTDWNYFGEGTYFLFSLFIFYFSFYFLFLFSLFLFFYFLWSAVMCCRELGQPMACQLWHTDLVLGVHSGLQPDEQISVSMHFLLISEKLLLPFSFWRKNGCFFSESRISNVLSTVRTIGTPPHGFFFTLPRSTKGPVGWVLPGSPSVVLCSMAWARSWPMPAAFAPWQMQRRVSKGIYTVHCFTLKCMCYSHLKLERHFYY